MNRPIFIFICSMLLLLPVVLAYGDVTPTWQLALCLPLILFLGIPHGAMDHVLFFRENKPSILRFVGVYLIVVAGNVVLWYYRADLAYVLFLLLSAYHFGQSQFSHLLDNSKLMNKLLHISWGISILSALILFNLQEIHDIAKEYSEFALLSGIHQSHLLRATFALACSLTVTFLILSVFKGRLSWESILMELLILSLILSCFFLMPLILGFTLYFIILHSVKVLREEFSYLKLQDQKRTFKDFFFLILPFTLVSIMGLGVLYLLIQLDLLPFSYGYISLVVISSITMPHAFVMNHFYSVMSALKLNTRLTN